MDPTQVYSALPMQEAKPSHRKLWMSVAMVLLVLIGVAGISVWNMNRETISALPAARVVINEHGMYPASIRIQKGQQVTITNNDVQSHHLAADESYLPGFASPDQLNAAESYTFVFNKVGTYHYYDPLDPLGYTGTVIVE